MPRGSLASGVAEMGGGDGAGNFVHEGSVNRSITGGTFLLFPESAKLQRSHATVRLILMHLFVREWPYGASVGISATRIWSGCPD